MAKTITTPTAFTPAAGRGLQSLQEGPGFGVTTLPPNIYFPDSLTPAMASPSPLIAQQRMAWFKVDALWGGTEAMRYLGQTMLPKEAYETPEEYEARLKRSTLVNYYKNTIQDAAGRVFAKDVKLVSAMSELTDTGSSTPPQLEFQNFAVDVDAHGNNLTQFVKSMFEHSVNHGVSFLLVDYPRTPVESFSSLEKQVESGSRPYWVNITASNVLDCRSAMIGGKQRMTLFKYEETVHELASDNISPASYQQIRIFKHDKDMPGMPPAVPMYAIYRRTLEGAGTNWALVEFGELTNADGVPLAGIPVVPVYTNRVGYGMGKPALDDLADLNITHYQMYSDYININHLTNVPFLFGKGIKDSLDDNGKKIPFILSPGKALATDTEYAEIKWVEHGGSSIASAKAALDDLISAMKECGLKLTQEVAPQGRTATEALVNVAESNSRLKSMALSVQDALNLALYYTAQFMGIADLTRAKVNTDFADIIANATDAPMLVEAFKVGAIGAETLIEEFQRRNILDPSMDIEPPLENEAKAIAPAELPETPAEEATDIQTIGVSDMAMAAADAVDTENQNSETD